MRRLIVNADDFGLTGGINRAVVDLQNASALTSATLMAAAPRFTEAVELALQNPSLGAGCHVVLVDGSPVADPASIESLLSTQLGPAMFRPTLGTFLRDLSLGRIQPAHIEREATAQIERLQQAGIAVTHIDTHKHTHMFPLVLSAVMQAAAACGIRTVRNPFEPAWCIKTTPNAGLVRKLQVKLLSGYQRNFRRLIRERGFITTDGCLGVLATGTVDEAALSTILKSMPDGTWELVCHPAYIDDELRTTRTRLQQSREIELSALHSLPDVLASLKVNVDQIHFGQLA